VPRAALSAISVQAGSLFLIVKLEEVALVQLLGILADSQLAELRLEALNTHEEGSILLVLGHIGLLLELSSPARIIITPVAAVPLVAIWVSELYKTGTIAKLLRAPNRVVMAIGKTIISA